MQLRVKPFFLRLKFRPSAISRRCQALRACPQLAAAGAKHLVLHGQSIQEILIGMPGGWTKMLHELEANALNGLALGRGQSLLKATPIIGGELVSILSHLRRGRNTLHVSHTVDICTRYTQNCLSHAKPKHFQLWHREASLQPTGQFWQVPFTTWTQYMLMKIACFCLIVLQKLVENGKPDELIPGILKSCQVNPIRHRWKPLRMLQADSNLRQPFIRLESVTCVLSWKIKGKN